MKTRGWVTFVAILAVLIIALAWLFFTTPVEAPTASSSQATTSASVPTATENTASSTEPLDASVVVQMPLPNAIVSHSFDVSGSAPSGWFFEATFPIQVRDANDDLIGTSIGQAQEDWTKPGPITFTSQIQVDASYEGPADLILLKDNPSGDPENADEVTIPIVIK